MSNSIVGLARVPEHLDVFSVGGDGRMNSAWWHDGRPWSGTFPIGGFFPPGAPVATVARMQEHLDVFVVGNDGRMYTSWWHQGQNWSGAADNWLPIGGFFPVQAHIAAVARMQEHLDVFVVGNDGRMYTSWWHQGENWSGGNDNWLPLGGAFPRGAPIAVVARMPGHLDVFAVGNDGRMYSAWWHEGGNWSQFFPIGGFFPPGAPVSAVARVQDHLDVFVVGNDGRVYTSWWHNGQPWSGAADNWLPIGGFFPVRAHVAAVARMPEHLDLFVVGNDGRMYTSWWHQGQNWSGGNDNWLPIGGFFPPGSPTSAAGRLQNHLDVFVVGNDGQMYTSWWHEGQDWSGRNDNWLSLLQAGKAPFEFSAPIVTGGLAALGGSFKVTIYPDGAIRWEGEATNSGIDSYDFGISALVKTASGRAVALARTGSIPNRVPVFGDTIRRSWNELQPPNPVLAAHFDEFAGANFSTNLEYQSGIGGALEKVVGWLIRFGVGSVIGPVGGAVVFIGVEVGSLATTGSLVPGARIVGNLLWLAGPANTLFALAAEGIAALGSRTRELTQEEYDWANNEVFLGSLPPRDRLVLTDSIGGGDRAFTFPRFDGKITLNMGPAAFADPRNYPGRARGQTFIHELVHACQIQHANMDIALLADAFASKVCEATGGNPYTYGLAGPDYSSFNLEQQAQIVSDWFAGAVPAGSNQTGVPKDINSPYIGYIKGNVRVGRF